MRAACSVLVVLAVLLSAGTAFGEKSSLRPQTLTTIGIDQRLGEQVPLDLAFRDEEGRSVKLGDFFHAERPVLLALVYNACPMLCNQVLIGMMSALDILKFDAGDQFEIVVVSFDPSEAPARAKKAKAKYLKRYDRPGTEQGVHFLTGEQAQIDALTKAVGFRYEYDEELEQYAHPSALTVLTPEGRVSRYFFGAEFSPRDMRFAFVEAADGDVGSVTDELLLLCYRYDPDSGTYSATAVGAIRVGGAATLLALIGFIGFSIRRERRPKGAKPEGEKT